MDKLLTIRWPSIVKLQGTSELIYLSNEAAMRSELKNWQIHTEDRLYDSDGREFQLGCARQAEPSASGRITTLDEIVDLIRHHAAAGGHCCVAKIQANSISKAFALIASDNDESHCGMDAQK